MNTVNGQKGLESKRFIPAIIWFLIVLVLLFLPGSDLPKVDDWFNMIHFDKWVHIGIFSVLAFLFMFPIIRSSLSATAKWHWVIRIALATSIWGLTSEVIQKYFIPGRSFDWFDWTADSIGAILALLLAKLRFLRES